MRATFAYFNLLCKNETTLVSNIWNHCLSNHWPSLQLLFKSLLVLGLQLIQIHVSFKLMKPNFPFFVLCFNSVKKQNVDSESYERQLKIFVGRWSGRKNSVFAAVSERVFKKRRSVGSEKKTRETRRRSHPAALSFISTMQTRTFFFLIAEDTSNQFEIKILQLVKQPRQLCSRHRIAGNFSSSHRKDFKLRRRKENEKYSTHFPIKVPSRFQAACLIQFCWL